MAIIIQVQMQQRQLTELQKYIITMYYNDGHSYDFLREFFHHIFPYDTELVDAYLDELFAPKMLALVVVDSGEEE